VAGIGDTRNVYKILMGIMAIGRSEDNIKMDLKERGSGDHS
jgi:hypothetical protein